MIPVNIEGVRRNFGISSVYMYTVTLIDETEQRIFNIGVERQDALPIVAALHHFVLPRPQTIDMMAETLKAFDIILQDVCIERLQLSPVVTLFALARLRCGETVREVDIRPGDALGLALLMEGPIFLSDELAKQIGVALAEGQTPELFMIEDLLKREGIALLEGKQLRLGYSKTPMCDALVKEFKASLLGKAPPFPEEDLEQRKKDYLAFLLREGASIDDGTRAIST